MVREAEVTYWRITTDDQDRDILAMNRPDAALASLFGLTERQVVDRRYNLRNRQRSRYGSSLPRSRLHGREAQVRAFIREGMWQPEMARRLGVSRGTLAGFIRRRGLRRPVPRRPSMRFDDPRVMASNIVGEQNDLRN